MSTRNGKMKNGSNFISNFLYSYFIYDNVIVANEATELRSEVASAAEL